MDLILADVVEDEVTDWGFIFDGVLVELVYLLLVLNV